MNIQLPVNQSQNTFFKPENSSQKSEKFRIFKDLSQSYTNVLLKFQLDSLSGTYVWTSYVYCLGHPVV